MKTIFLIRHAKSSWDVHNVEDHERPLSERGFSDAPHMAEHLYNMGIRPQLALCSTSKRTKQTYSFFTEKFKGIPLNLINSLYHASKEVILEQLKTIPNTYQAIFLFGHNPGIEDFVQTISENSHQVPTCTVAHITFDVNEWKNISFSNALLVNLMTPKSIL